MILQALYDYYYRKANSDGESGIAPLGMEWKEIPFVIVIDHKGNFVRLEERSEGSGKDKRIERFLVPQAKSRSGKNSWIVAFDFWDHYGYVLGVPKASILKKGTEDDIAKAEDDGAKQNGTFKEVVAQHCATRPENEAFRAVDAFYANESNKDLIRNDSLWETLIKKDGTNMSFRLVTEKYLIAEHPDLRTPPSEVVSDETSLGVCLITGEKAPIRILHTGLSLPGGKAGAKLVGFQTNSGYDSYYKEQGRNAPISEQAESAYSTALKTLLDKDSANKYRLGDTQFLFWAQKQCHFEGVFAKFFTPAPKDAPDRNIQAIRQFMQSMEKGVLSEEEQTPFYLLGLSPNAARIVVRSWQAGTVRDFADKIRQHFLDLEMIRNDKNEREYFSLFNLLTQVSFQYKLDNLPPNMVGDVMQAVIKGTPYPVTLQLHCINRVKTDRSISYIRAAILKACLNRKNRFTNYSTNKDITMALDKENIHPAYLCGRLFATLEKIQEEANPGINATIKDRYYAAASATPSVIFPRLMSLKNHHLPKLPQGRIVNMEKLLGAILQNISADGFPKHLSLDDQSRFFIGYYHQRQDFFISKDKTNQE